MVVVPACVAGLSPARPQDPGTLDEKQMPPLAHPDSPSTPAKELFARKTKPVPLAARSIGFYSHGCLAGAVALPIDGSTWQVMRLSRIGVNQISASSPT
jgi:penicillin-insensitive murein endopeptidase